MLLVGDAAGFCLNLGVTVRGMEYAIASGLFAAEAIKHAKEKDDFSEKTLGKYTRLLDDSFVMKDMKTFRHAHEVLANPRIYGEYPETAARVLEGLFTVPDGAKKKLWKTAFPEIRKLLVSLGGFKDYLGFRKI